MHYLRNPRHTQSMIAYLIFTEYLRKDSIVGMLLRCPIGNITDRIFQFNSIDYLFCIYQFIVMVLYTPDEKVMLPQMSCYSSVSLLFVLLCLTWIEIRNMYFDNTLQEVMVYYYSGEVVLCVFLTKCSGKCYWHWWCKCMFVYTETWKVEKYTSKGWWL